MKRLLIAITFLCAAVGPSWAQMAPPPRAAPRIPVHRETIAEQHHPVVQRDIDGPALILDGEKLRVDDVDVRLFGIVPPQLSASFGPQAREALDSLLGGGQNVECHIRDRDHDGRLLATCHAANGTDPALDLLRRGLAVAARGSLDGTELSEPYITAEKAAQAAKLGLWATGVPASADSPPVIVAIPPVTVAKAEVPPVKATDLKSNNAKPDDAKPALAADTVATKPAILAEKGIPKPVPEDNGVFARYQSLIAGSLMFLTVLCIIGALAVRRFIEKRDEMRAVAAALRGELLAARAVCLSRVKCIVTPEDDAYSAWPRIRSTLYAAHVGRLGWLGAEMARQVASIYGQASDYASYYNNHPNEIYTDGSMPKRHALQTLASHIDEVLPRLAKVEKTGRRLPMKKEPKRATASLAVPVAARIAPLRPVTPMIAHQQAEPAVPRLEKVTVALAAPALAERKGKLMGAVRRLRARLAEPERDPYHIDEQVIDYVASIEEEAERFSYGGGYYDPNSSQSGRSGRM